MRGGGLSRYLDYLEKTGREYAIPELLRRHGASEGLG